MTSAARRLAPHDHLVLLLPAGTTAEQVDATVAPIWDGGCTAWSTCRATSTRQACWSTRFAAASRMAHGGGGLERDQGQLLTADRG